MVDQPKASETSAGSPKPVDTGLRRNAFSGRGSLRSPREALQPDNAPPPPSPLRRRRSPIIATASGLLSFIGIAAIALAVVWSLGVQRINAPGPLPSDKTVTIAPGTDVSGIVDQLADEGVIESRPLMTATLWLEGSRRNVKAGEYMFRQSASLREVIDTVVSGKQILHSITIPEGLTSEQVADRLRANDVLVGDILDTPKEGSLMPDTFKFERGTTRDQVIRTMQAEEKKVLAEVWSHRSADTPIRSPYELVTLASIVEKETGRADERPRVAGVFVNRLTHSMPLQSDPTIVYGLVGGKGTLGRGILRSELEQKTPYNTYTIPGLPPGPIANPGKAALEAVANPSRTKDLYFVADGTGGHVFSDNLDQHRQNVARWRQIEKDAKDKAEPDADKMLAPSGPATGTQPRPSQRSDASSSPGQVFGALDGTAGANGAGPKPVSAVTAFPINGFAAGGAFSTPSAAGEGTATAAANNFDELDIEVDGVRSKSDPGGDGDNTASTAQGEEQVGSMQTFPVSPQHLAAEKAQALAYGLQPPSDRPPPPGQPDKPVQNNNRFGKVIIIDASEGTALDPLRDKSYDLNSAKVVPSLKPLPPLPSTTSIN